MSRGSLDPDLPEGLRGLISGHGWNRQTIGQSQAGVFRLEAKGKPTLFLKIEPGGPFAELADEAARLRWLGRQDIDCPEVIAFETHAGHDWLLMSAVPGRDLVSAQPIDAATSIGIMADALRRLHALDISACPFDHSLDRRIAIARARMEAGEVDETDFDDERLGWTAAKAFAELQAQKPDSEDLVVTHGDACMPNFMVADNRFSGFIDCGRLGIADRHQDLALACWSIRYNLGEAWEKPFLERYGSSGVDPGKLSWYRLLDEFF
ncbi:APH(3')-II family aminoglycoside O-phosphotransferase [Mesorhizobium sp. INR15]|uniref:APH(3')-II family aminoglycoside O-phosphotransferase n=1 Tax=Mesorhizobium sp. INR15 TaxID=2654248 RepID=UPI0018966975|nr:APH(3') family aminoglycoside O-phosphotransferase [Mesorhizobium sp. INR15]QPC91256.1 APH(3') family aminoglycoside O-phosphotransferase [Mesorhizobium sp. INR15]